MPLHLPKLFKVRYQTAIDAVGVGTSVYDTLKSLEKSGAIHSFEVVIEIKVDRDKAFAIENFFLNKEFNQEPTSIGKRKKNNDY